MLLALLLAASQSWSVEPEQALVSIEVSGVSGVSHRLSGTLREAEGGAVVVSLEAAAFDRIVSGAQIVFEGTAPAAGRDGVLRFVGNVTLHGTTLPVTLPLTLARIDRHAFAHATLLLHLRQFGLVLPEGASDLARVDIDAGLVADTRLAQRG